MRNDDWPAAVPPYADHVGLWADELMAWVPDVIFDAHVHLGPPEVMGALSPERRKMALSTFTSLTWEGLEDVYRRLYRTKRIAGLVAFGFPLREVDVEAANRYVLRVMKNSPKVKGFLLAHPTDAKPSLAMFDAALDEGVRFFGVKPYFDFLGKDVFQSTMPEFIPEPLLEFMDRERLILLLHTSGTGMGDSANQDYLRSVMERFPRVRIILAHMGRYLELGQFHAFCDSGLLEYPMLYLEMSSASLVEVYRRVLSEPNVHGRLLFGSDLPFGLITGVESWSETHGPIFVTRESYPWSDPILQESSPLDRNRLTYNTYHTIKALKDALESMRFPAEQVETIKQGVFFGNASALF
ncbi:MAG: amidohydrolase family protein [Planctomycetota bacterium]